MKKRLAGTRTSLAMALCLGGLLGCAQPTYYTPASNGYGYAERQISPERYQVVFAGNHKTRRETAHQYVLFRAAQLAEQGGFHYVAVNDQTQRVERYGDLRSRPTQRVDLGLDDGYGGSGGFNNKNDDDGVRSTVERYQAILDVSFYEDEASIPSGDREVYQTDEVLNDLGQQIEYEGEETSGKYLSDYFNRSGRQQYK